MLLCIYKHILNSASSLFWALLFFACFTGLFFFFSPELTSSLCFCSSN